MRATGPGQRPWWGSQLAKKKKPDCQSNQVFFCQLGATPALPDAKRAGNRVLMCVSSRRPTYSRGRFTSKGWGASKDDCPPAQRAPKGMGLQAQWERRQARQGAQRPRARSHASGGGKGRQGAQRPSPAQQPQAAKCPRIVCSHNAVVVKNEGTSFFKR